MTMHGSPQTLGRFQLVRELARGGQGVVYEAYDPRLDARRAIKLLLAPDSALQQQRVQREIESLGRLEHPRVVKLHEVGTAHGRPFLVYGFVDGESLEARLQRGGPLPWIDALRLTRRLAGAISAAHAVGVLHRDLKPGNVLLDGAGEPYLADFGLAALRESDQSLTRTGQALGSPGYWPPEQAAGDRTRIGPRSDVYGLGAILYAAVTGQPPQAGRTLQEIAAQTDEPPPPPSAHLPELPASVDEVCLRCLQPDPARRYESAEAVAAACREAQVGASAPGPGLAPRRIAAAILVAAALGAAGLVALSSRGRAPEVASPLAGEPVAPPSRVPAGPEVSPPAATPAPSGSTPTTSEQTAEAQAERERMIAAVRARDFALLERLASARVERRGVAATCDDWTLLATGLMGLGRAEEGLASFAHASGLDPDNEVPIKNLVSLLGARDRWREALPWSVRLCELRPDNAWNWAQRARALFADSRYVEAVDAAGRSLALDPEDKLARLTRARALLWLGRRDEAYADGQLLRQPPSDPSDPWGCVLVGMLEVKRRNLEEARRILALPSVVDNVGAQAHGLLAGLTMLQDPDQGRADLQRLLSAQPQPRLFLTAVGARYLECDELSAAEHMFTLALDGQVDARILRQRALARLAGGDLAGARDDLQSALAEDQDQVTAWVMLEVVRARSEDAAGAAEARSRAEALDPAEAARARRLVAALLARRGG